MYPEVEEYFRVEREARKAMEDAYAEADYNYNKIAREAKFTFETEHPTEQWDSYQAQRRGGRLYDPYRAYVATREAAAQAYDDAKRNRKDLLVASKDLAVKWIAENSLDEYPDYSAAVLKVLPVEDTSVLWDIKRQHGMCETFDRLYARADAEGVFNGGKKAPGARELAALHNWISRNYGDRYARDIRAQMSTYVKAVKEHYEAEMATAKAEWQGLDEARRSEAARKAAATRAANRSQADAQAESEGRAYPVDEVEDNTGEIAFSDFVPERAADGIPLRVLTQDDFASVAETAEKVNS